MTGRPLRIDWHDFALPLTSQPNINIRTRLYLMWLIRSGWQTKMAAEVVGTYYRSAHRWVEWYNCSLPNLGVVGKVHFIQVNLDFRLLLR